MATGKFPTPSAHINARSGNYTGLRLLYFAQRVKRISHKGINGNTTDIPLGNDAPLDMTEKFEFPVLIGDIGGTNSRFAILRDSHSQPEMIEPVNTSKFDSLEQAVETSVLEKTSIMPRSLVLGIAGPISAAPFNLTNGSWVMDPNKILSRLNLQCVEFMNDFAAQALGVLAIDREKFHQIGDGVSESEGTKIVLGPGTGFGTAIIIKSNQCWIVLPGEGGHLAFGAGDEAEMKVWKHLEKEDGRWVVETVLSGRGLENLYRALCISQGQTPDQFSALSAAEISAAASNNSNRFCVETVQLFTRLLGRQAGNLALLTLSRGGVYIGGGIAQKMKRMLEDGSFRQAFENQGPFSATVKEIATYLIDDEQPALQGLARYVRIPEQFDLALSRVRYLAV